MADQKLTELTAASTLTGAELIYIVQGGVSKRTTVSSLMGRITWPIGHGDTHVHLSGSSTVNSAGTQSTTPWLSFDKTLYEVAVIELIAMDNTDKTNHTVGKLTVIVDAPDYDDTHEIDDLHVDGANTVTIPPADIVGNTVNLRFQRQSETNNPITVRYSVDLWKR